MGVGVGVGSSGVGSDPDEIIRVGIWVEKKGNENIILKRTHGSCQACRPRAERQSGVSGKKKKKKRRRKSSGSDSIAQPENRFKI